MTTDAPTGWIRQDILATSAYPVEKAPGGTLRLDAMESPFDLPEAFHRRLGEEMAGISLNRYPDGSASELKEILGKSLLGLSPDHLFLGNGSDEILQTLFLATTGPLLLAEPTFSMYRILAEMTGRTVVTATLSEDLDLDVEALLAAARKHHPSLIVLSSPNNPTGRDVSEETVDRICREFSGGVLVDEAYFPFSGWTALSLQRAHPRLMVLRTLSKMGLAALRLGILAADPKIVAELDKVRLPYNLNLLTQRAAILVCREFLPDLESQVRSIIHLREDLLRSLSAIPGVCPLPSSANFLLIRIGGKDPSVVARALADRGILVRDVSRHHPLLAGCLRVTIGTATENERFAATLALILKGTP